MSAPESHDLLSLCSSAAAKYGGRVAAQHGSRQISYAELFRCARAFGTELRSQGLGPGEFAALQMENSLEYVVALLGIFAAGATAVPVNPDTPACDLNAILSDCGARVLITRDQILARLEERIKAPKVVVLAASFEKNSAIFSGAPLEGPTPGPSAPAMVLYTSGTTGRPKGTVLTHRNLVANTCSIVEYLGLTCEDSIVNVLPFFHSFGNSVLLTHLAVGGKVIVENGFAFPGRVVQAMQSLRPTGFSGVPTTFYILIHKTNFLQQDWSFLRYISQAGGGMREETVAQLRRSLPKSAIYIMYGQTEASARLSYVPPDMLERKIGSIGIAIPGCELRVVNAAGQPVRGDEVGEIIARGPNIMQGYLNDPEGSAAVLRDGWLYTGDMARVDEDGFVYIVGRKGDFIKSAGYRIGPVEIEEVIAAGAPEIEDVAVFGVPDEVLGEAVAACVCCPREKFDPVRIRNMCMARMPLWKVPKYVIHTTQIPRTASGKKQYFVLREKYRGLASGS
jgi:acyl-CoA synthetase (AMP-forming)/AMP-acid ligase II